MKTEAELAERFIERVCPDAEVDRMLRHNLLTFRPEPGETRATPLLAVDMLKGEQKQLALAPVLDARFWSSREAQRRFIRGLGEHFGKEKLRPCVVYLVAEAWTKTWPKGEAPKGPIDLKLQEVKSEIIMAGALTIDGRAAEAHAEILRDAEARISGYGEIESIGCGTRQANGEPRARAGILEPFFQGYFEALFPERCAN